MVQSLRGTALPYPREDVVAELESLREELRAARHTGEGTHLKMPGVVRAALDAAMLPIDVAEPAAAPQPVPSGAIRARRARPAPAVELPAPAAQQPVPEPAARAPESEVIAVVDTPMGRSLPSIDLAPGTPEAPAEPARQFEAGKDQRKIKDDVDRDLLPVFLDEAKEIIPALSEGVRRWKDAPTDHSPVAELQRHLHTLKGSARMTGLMRLGELAHVLEEPHQPRWTRWSRRRRRSSTRLEERVDRFSLSLERLAKGEDILEAEPVEVPVSAVFEHQKDKPAALAVMAAAVQEKPERDALPPEMRESRQALLRVNADMIDRFVNEAGEMSIARSRIEGEMANFKRALSDLTENISRMRTQLREIEIATEGQMQSTIKLKEEHGEQFDPLEFDRFSRMQELTRFLAESLGDVITLHQGLQKNLDETELAIHAQARLNRELQQGLMGVRLVPLGNLADRFYRVVRQTAKELDKKANLELKGTRTELDRSVLEKITAPFEHLLRNAIAHGIEKPEDARGGGQARDRRDRHRRRAARQRGRAHDRDDGAGLNFARIREKAVHAGLLAPDVELPEAQLAQFIFMPGFSTATEVSQIAGRGVGMDVVKNEITSLGGRVEIASTAGPRRHLHDHAAAHARGDAGGDAARGRARLRRALGDDRAGAGIQGAPRTRKPCAKGEIAWKDNRYPLRSLLPLLGEIDTPTPARQIPVLLLKSGLQRAAIRVDEIIGNREVVVKTIGPQLARLAGIAGATVLGNGQVVLILNPVQLVHRESARGRGRRAPATPVPRRPRWWSTRSPARRW